VFNIADAAITIGVLTLVIFQKKLLGQHPAHNTTTTSQKPEEVSQTEL
jgi:lipoprotein signal peptidase